MDSPVFTMIPANGGILRQVTGGAQLTKVSPAMSGGAFTVMVAEVPVGAGPPLHYHDQDSEWIFVLDGQITVETKAGSVLAGPGDSVFLPAGQAHGFRNTGDTPAHLLGVSTPGAQLERFFEELDETLHGAIDPPLMARIAARHGITYGLPPAAA